MVRSKPSELVGKGIYALHEAARLANADGNTVRRWLLGYSYKHSGKTVTQPPIFRAEIGRIEDDFFISFVDLVELLFVANFRRRGIKWSVIKTAFESARDRFESDHPFSVLNFQTDGKRIFEETVLNGRRQLTDLEKKQLLLGDFIDRTLSKTLQFEKGSVRLWYPEFPSRLIVLDPSRSFGRPIVASNGVPTEVIFGALEADDDVQLVAREFGITAKEVRAVAEFQERLAA